MNSQPEEELQRRLRELEAKINSSSTTPSPQETRTPTVGFANWKLYLERFRTWFGGLSVVNKLVVTGVAMLLSGLLLQTVFKLVSSVISLALLAGLVYLGYKFFVSNSFQNKQ
ncbi:MAG TPA: hypothetical protein VK203_21070 [Nostocaceae cyanobacterium]|nr:hypothetical protein [Nostocaceae cyanobacterium]